MAFYPLRYLPTGHVFIDPADDCNKVVDSLLETGYSEDFCLARDFKENFISRLMEAGFLVMSTELKDVPGEEEDTAVSTDRFFILLPKLHLIRSVLFFPELHIKKSIHPFLSRYELRHNTDFDHILDKCIAAHGDAWLTPPLVNMLKNMHHMDFPEGNLPPWARRQVPARPVSFGVYRDGELKAGEIGVTMGRVYTSYTGYYEEDNAGTVQIILMVQWLQKNGFDFLDFGMPLSYKTSLGARNIEPGHFIAIFRAAQ